MAKRRYYQDLSQIRRRVENLRAYIAQKHRGFVRQTLQRFGEEYPLTKLAWWLVQHVGQIKLTIAERLNHVERVMRQSKIYRETVERLKQYVEDTERLADRLVEYSKYIETIRRDPWEFEHRVVGDVLRLLQGKEIDYSRYDPVTVAALNYYLEFMTKRRGPAAYLDAGRVYIIRNHFPKTRVQLYVHLILAFEAMYGGKTTRHITVRTPYVVHVDDYYANRDYYNTLAYNYAIARVGPLFADWYVEEYEIMAVVRERL
ncbi:MAG: hypothetical protein ACPL3C_07820 [Pyrobaculum sp.]